MGRVTRARWCVVRRACWLPTRACGLRFLGVAGGYWRGVGEGVFLPPFLLLLVFLFGCGKAKGGGVGRVFSFFFLCEGCGFWWL